MDVVLAARTHLASISTITALVPAKDKDPDPWIFRHRLPLAVENTGGTAILLRQLGSWTTPNTHNTARFPRLVVEIYSDPVRGLTQPGPSTLDSYSKCLLLADLISDELHVVDGSPTWGTLRIVSSKRLDEPAVYEVPDSDGLVKATMSFAVTVG